MTDHLNHVKWAGWGVVNVEALDRQQRRNYLKKVRTELAAKGYTLHPGGTTQTPWYKAVAPGTEAAGKDQKAAARSQVVSGADAFAKICAWILSDMGEKQGTEDAGSSEVGTV